MQWTMTSRFRRLSLSCTHTTATGSADQALAALVEKLIEDRNAAREGRDFGAADRIRDELAEAGITVEDSPTGTHWSIEQ